MVMAKLFIGMAIIVSMCYGAYFLREWFRGSDLWLALVGGFCIIFPLALLGMGL